MTWKTIAKPHVKKHAARCSNIKAFTLENSFRGDPIPGFSDYALANGKMQINPITGKGKLRLHSNCWYDFDYKIEEKKPR